MKMMCIANNKPKSNGINLTIGKIYEVSPMFDDFYNEDKKFFYMKYRKDEPDVTNFLWERELFISMAKYREKQINSILDESDL